MKEERKIHNVLHGLYKLSLLFVLWNPYTLVVSVTLALVCYKTNKDKLVKIILIFIIAYIAYKDTSGIESKVTQTFILACILFFYQPIADWIKRANDNKVMKK
ncbi:MAG TPA: hypothetical protein IAA29_01645 [Candidatus Paenibacillus intestinavium]|nr:hypothetical protein [Candidatus Paenibacillus intestinavium]